MVTRWGYCFVILLFSVSLHGQLIPGVVASGVGESKYVIYYTNYFDRPANAQYTEAMLNADYTSDGFVQYDDNTNIYSWGGEDNVWRAYFEAGHCCTGTGCDWGDSTGVGINMSLEFPTDQGFPAAGLDSGFNSMNVCYSDPFEIGDMSMSPSFVEMKNLPGWRAQGSADAIIRLRIDRDDNSGYNKYFSWYYERYTDGGSSILVACGSKSSDTIHMSGECYNFTVFAGNNDVGSANGVMAFYLAKPGDINAHLICYTGGLKFSQAGQKWDTFEANNFIGGCDQEAFCSEVDQYTIHDDHVIWNDTSLVYDRTDGSSLPDSITLPDACNYPQTYHGSME